MRPTPSFFLFSFLLAALFAVALAEGEPTLPQSLRFENTGGVWINGAPYQAPLPVREKIYAEVARVFFGAEGNIALYLRPLEIRRLGRGGRVESVRAAAGEPRPYSYDSSWTMYDAQGAETDEVRLAQHVLLPLPSRMANSLLFEARWNECEGPVSGNYTGLPCSTRRGLSDDYVAYLKKHIIPCVSESLVSLELAPAVSVHLTHDGTLADARHHGGSLHAAGRAIDIQTIAATGAAGEVNTFDFRITSSQPESRDRKFYEKFRQCWGRLQLARRCRGRTDGPIGTVGWEDINHRHHHLHTSYPYCPNSKGYFVTQRELP